MTSFTWRDGDRLIRFGRGAVDEAVDLLGGPGFTLLTTERAAAAAPHVALAAAQVHHVGSGLVPDLAGDLLGSVRGTAWWRSAAGAWSTWPRRSPPRAACGRWRSRRRCRARR